MNDRPFDVISIKSRITADNDAIAAEVRELMKEKKIFFMNLMAQHQGLFGGAGLPPPPDLKQEGVYSFIQLRAGYPEPVRPLRPGS